MRMNLPLTPRPVLLSAHHQPSRASKVAIALIGAAALAGCAGLNAKNNNSDSANSDTYTAFPYAVDCARANGDENLYEPFKNLKLESPYDDDGWADAVNTNEKNVPVTDCVYRGTPWEIDGDFLFDDHGHKKAHYKSGKTPSHKRNKAGLPTWNPSTASSGSSNHFASPSASPSSRRGSSPSASALTPTPVQSSSAAVVRPTKKTSASPTATRRKRLGT